jgi:hypothetical protein
LCRYADVRNPLLGIDAASSLIQEEIFELLRAPSDSPGAAAAAAAVTVPVPVLRGLLGDVEDIRCCVGHMHRLVVGAYNRPFISPKYAVSSPATTIESKVMPQLRLTSSDKVNKCRPLTGV